MRGSVDHEEVQWYLSSRGGRDIRIAAAALSV